MHQTPWWTVVSTRALRWLWGRLITFFSIATVAVVLIFLRAGVQPRPGGLPSFHWDRYWPALKQYVGHLLSGTWGYFYQPPPPGGGYPEPVPSGATIGPLLARAMPNSLIVIGLALLFGIVLGVTGGMLASRFARRWVRPAAIGSTLTLLSFPDILLLVLAQFAIIFSSKVIGFEVLAPFGTFDGTLTLHTVLMPALILSLFPAASIARLSAAAFDDIYVEDYIRTARSKGLSERRVIWTHALRNAIIQVLGGLPAITGLMISNLIVIEYLTAFFGVGRMLATWLDSDYPSPNLIASIVICFTAVFTLVDGAVDALLLWLDPRARDPKPPAATSGKVKRLWRRLVAHLTGKGREARPSQATVRAAIRPAEEVRGDAPPTAHATGGARAGADAPGRHPAPGWFQRAAAALHPAAIAGLLKRFARAYRGNLPLTLGSLIVLALVLVALFAPQLAPRKATDATLVMQVDGEWRFIPFPPGTPGFPLGSDRLGRDMLSLLIYGTRFTLLIAGLIVPLRVLVALPIGLATGWFRGLGERLLNRLATALAAIPALVVPAMLVPVVFVPHMPQTMANPNAPPPPEPLLVLMFNVLILVMLGWPRLAESIRLMTRELAERPFVEGARAVGVTDRRLLFRHLLPHLLPRLAMIAAAETAWVMMLLAQLGIFNVFLGGMVSVEGRQPVAQYPDWSHLLAHPVRYLWANQWVILFPALAFFVAMLGFNLIAEGLRRASLRSERAPAAAPARPAQKTA